MEARTAFVFAGGGSLGAIQVGMLHALIAAGERPDLLVGTSVGAINAAYFAGAPDLAGVEALAGIWARLTRADVFPFNLGSIVNIIRHRDCLVDPAPLRRLIEGSLGYTRLEDALVPLHVMATDQQGMSVRLSHGEVATAVLASAAIPAVFPPVVINGEALMDGAIAANTPLRLAAELGATRIIVLPTGYACALNGPPSGVIASALHAITLLIAWQLMHEIAVMPATVSVHLAPALCPLAVSPYDFSASRQLIERARDNTSRWIDSGGLQRPAYSRELAPHHHHPSSSWRA